MPIPSDIPLSRVPLPGLLEIASETMFGDFHAELEAAGFGDIRPTHGCVFRFVRDEGMRLTAIAGAAGMTKQSVGEVVDDLVERGYVERFPDPADRRATLIRLTARGEEVQGIAYELFAGVEKRWAARYGPERFAQLRRLLEEIAAAEAPTAVPELSSPELAGA